MKKKHCIVYHMSIFLYKHIKQLQHASNILQLYFVKYFIIHDIFGSRQSFFVLIHIHLSKIMNHNHNYNNESSRKKCYNSTLNSWRRDAQSCLINLEQSESKTRKDPWSFSSETSSFNLYL